MPAPLRDLVVRLTVAAAVVLLALDGGTYDLSSRNSLAIVVWWSVALAAIAGLLAFERLPVSVLVTAGSFAAFGAWTGASTLWAESEAKALAEFNRVALYGGVFLLAACLSTRLSRRACSDGLAIGVAAVGLIALGGRLFGGLESEREVTDFLPGYAGRLNYPLAYPNALAILIALGLPLLLRTATAEGRAAWRGLALAPFPALVGALYLTSSRGGAGASIVGVLAFLALTNRRWVAAGAAIVAGLGSAAVVMVLVSRPELVDSPLSTLADQQGRSAAGWIAAICVLTGATFAASTRLVGASRRPSPLLGWATVSSLLVAGAVGLAAAHPLERFREFKRPPASVASGETSTVASHLLSVNGTGRWQHWQASVDQFRESPLLGQGAGSYEAWWAQHGSVAIFVLDAHSLYLETLGELGAVGILLLLAVFLAGVVPAGARMLRLDDEARTTTAGLLAAFFAFVVGAGVDWMWEVTVVSVVGFACLGLLLPGRREPVARPTGRLPAARLSVVAVALAVVVALGLPLLSSLQLQESQEAAAAGDLPAALAHADAARKLEPWASSPYLQLALVTERAGNLLRARGWIQEALERDSSDWRLWLVSARIETRLGTIRAGQRSLLQAKLRNPRSPLFADNPPTAP